MNSSPPDADPAPARDSRSGFSFRAGAIIGGVAVLVLAAVVGAVAVLVRPSAPPDGMTAAQEAALRTRSEQDHMQVQALRGQLAAADAELAIERAARLALEDNLAALQTQAGQLRDRVAFYDQLFPAGPAGTISIRAIEIARVPSGLRYRVLLMRSARPGLAPFVGGLRFTATGTRSGEQVRLPLAPLQTDPGTEGADAVATSPTESSGPVPPDPAVPAQSPPALVPLEVGQYRGSEGILALPPDFTPAEVSVDVVQDGAVLASQQAAVAF